MDAAGYELWLRNREAHRQELFGEALSGPSQLERTQPALASLALSSFLQGELTEEDLYLKSMITNSVPYILANHDNQAHEADGYALFGLARYSDLSALWALTTEVLWTLEQAGIRAGQTPRFAELPAESIDPSDLERPDVQMVVETAAAVCEVLQAGYLVSTAQNQLAHLTAHRGTELARFIAQRGASYALAWIRGDIIREYCEQHDADANQWLHAVSPADRIEIALRNPRDPISDVLSSIDRALLPPHLVPFASVRNRYLSLQPPAHFYSHALLPCEVFAEKKQALSDWLSARQGYRELLFGDTADESTLTARQRPSLAKIARTTPLAGTPRIDEAYEISLRSHIPGSVDSILDYYNRTATDDGERASPKELTIITSLTIKVISLWERACIRACQPSLFVSLPETVTQASEFERQDVRLVVETASVVRELLQAGYPSGGPASSRHHTEVARFIAQRGPAFALAWIRGDIIRAYAQQHDIDAEQWLDWFPRSYLAHFAIKNTHNPMKGVLRSVNNLEHELTTEKIMAATNWSKKRVEMIFSPGARIDLARAYTKPLVAAERIAARIDSTLTIENLAASLHIPTEAVEKIFAPWMRYRLARHQAKPIPAARSVMKLFNILTGEYGLSDGLAAYAAYQFRNAAIPRAKQYLKERDNNRPPDVTEAMWAAAVVRYPDPHDKRRTQSLAAYRLWKDAHFARRLDSTQPNFDESAQDSASAPGNIAMEDVVLPDEPGDYLQEMAKKAGVSYSQLKTLMRHYAEHGAAPEEGDLLAILKKLQQAV